MSEFMPGIVPGIGLKRLVAWVRGAPKRLTIYIIAISALISSIFGKNSMNLTENTQLLYER
jgi:hypothetical protein